MMTKVKICGITNLADALAACEAGADALGFVLAPEARKRNRYIDADAAAAIIARLPVLVTTVAVVVNEPLERLRELLTVFDRLQLHGDESADICSTLGRRAFKAFRAGPGLTQDTVAAWPGEACLLDAWSEESHGGTGARCDWRFAAEAAKQKKLILAGGLSPENVEEAILRVRPFAVDASSSLEASPGKKNHERIRLFIYNTRKASLA
jgi:phosphoribosylanthranilate isomerase